MGTQNASETMGSEVAQGLKGLGWKAIAGLVAVSLLVLVGVFLLGGSWKTGQESSSPSINKIQKLGELVVLRINVADVMADASHDYQGVWIVKGDAEVAVDLRLAKLLSADEETKRLEVRLPQPRVIQASVDHQKSQQVSQSKTTWIPFRGDRVKMTNQGWAKAQKMVERACAEEESMDQARGQTAFILTNMYRMVGWDVDIVWQEGS